MKRGKGKRTLRGILALLGLGALLLCTSLAAEPVIVSSGGRYDPYLQAVCRSAPGLRAEVYTQGSYHILPQGGVMECYDAQAVPAIRQGVGGYWYPQCLATAVIVLDRDQTDACVTGWNDLRAPGQRVGWNGNRQGQQLLVGAVSYGLEGENFACDEALKLMRAQREAGFYAENDWQAPIMVCFDYQAAALARQGRRLSIVIPREGTLTFALGLLSGHRLVTPADGELLAAGLRLLDGRCQDPVYPDQRQYDRAEQLKEFSRFQKATGDIFRGIRRQVLQTRLYSPADTRESIMAALVGVVLALLWMGAAGHRSIRPDIQRGIHLCAMVIVGWLLLRVLKYQLRELTLLNRYCWYGYYIFQIGLPLVMLYIAAIIDRREDCRKLPRWLYPFLAAYPLLVALVFTNDLHWLVFRFDQGPNWADFYSYGPGYFVIYGYCILTFLLSLLLLVKKSWKSPKRAGWLLPVLLALVIILYATAYNRGVPLARDSDFTMTMCVLGVLFFETALRTGLIPSNTRYKQLFSSSPLDMQLLDREGRTVLAAGSAAPLEPVLRVQLQSCPGVVVRRDENTLLYGCSIHGGTVVWQEDITQLNRLQQEVQASVERLQAANALLRQQGKVRHQQLAVEVKAELFAALEQEIEVKTDALSRAIRTLPEAEDRERRIAWITLLLCHIKRRCNLFFLAREGQSMSGDELSIYLDELSEFAGYAGVKALVRSGVSGPVNVREATLCYDFYFDALSRSVRGTRATLLGQLEQGEDGLCFRILTEEEMEDDPFPQSFLEAVHTAGGQAACRDLEETAGLYLTFPKGGRPHE